MSIISTSIEKFVHPVESQKDLTPLIEKLAESRIVMLGEASHGTHEYYEWRSLISQELIEKHGFQFIAVEGDWPACAELNQFLHSAQDQRSVRHVLRNFNRWPTWMWANDDVIDLALWLKSFNAKQSAGNKIGFFGLDIYSLFESADQVLKALDQVDANLAKQARIHYSCFDRFQKNEKRYAKSLVNFPAGCEIQVLKALQHPLQIRLLGFEHEKIFDVQQNVRIAKNAEQYYRAMIHGDEQSSNVRDRHMLETLDLLLQHKGPESKCIVWAHNTHIGDYRATDMVEMDQINLGGLARDLWGRNQVCLVGFGSYQGEVTASHAWDGPTEVIPVPASPVGTYEEIFHQVAGQIDQDSFYIWMKDHPLADLKVSRGHRAIGVVYNPTYERYGNYVPTSLSERYDAFIFIDETTALDPLVQNFSLDEFPETRPRGF